MIHLQNRFNSLRQLKTSSNNTGYFHSLENLENQGFGNINRLPTTIKILLESAIRNYDGKMITEDQVEKIANWQPNEKRNIEIPFIASRILLQDYTGIPLLADLAAMRSLLDRLGINPKLIEPQVPTSLVIDHSMQIYHAGFPGALELNMRKEFQDNHERYKFIKWAMQAFNNLKVAPPGNGIVHQINLEYFAQGVMTHNGICYPDSVIGTDSHTTMINGLGILGWGVGGIEAEANMLGQPIYLLMPEVVGVRLDGRLREGVTATDLALSLTHALRKEKIVDKFLEFYGEGVTTLSAQDRATIANMAPEYGATVAFFSLDEMTLNYLHATGRTKEQIDLIEYYYKAQGIFGTRATGEVDYSQTIHLDLNSVELCVAGPRQPQERISLSKVKNEFNAALTQLSRVGKKITDAQSADSDLCIEDGDILIASISSCTNTSNPYLMLAAGILAKNAVIQGLTIAKHIKTSFTPGSRVVSSYLEKSGLQSALDTLGFNVVGYGCGACNGNGGPLSDPIEKFITEHKIIACSVLSGNRNFESRIHQAIKANYLMSPMLVVAYAISGSIKIDFFTDPIGHNSEGIPVFLNDILPSHAEVMKFMELACDPQEYRKTYSNLESGALWDAIEFSVSHLYHWDEKSTYIAEPPFLSEFNPTVHKTSNIYDAQCLLLLGDSITTDHISPGGAIKPDSIAGLFLKECGVNSSELNTYGARRGNHEVMLRGAFANNQIKNLMLGDTEGGFTTHHPSKTKMSIYEAAMNYKSAGVPSIIFAGENYGCGSSRDWAAKATYLLGVKVVIAKSFERIHRSNLIGMGVLPCEFAEQDTIATLNIKGDEKFDIIGLEGGIIPRKKLFLIIKFPNNSQKNISLTVRVDTSTEADYFNNGGILPYMLRKLISSVSGV